MNRIAGRAAAALVLALVLIAGMVFFIGEYFIKAGDWVVFPGNPHVYNAGNIGCGTVVSREGTELLRISDDRSYADDRLLRQATLHWLGDREGNISAPALSAYSRQMAGFNVIQGVYSYSGTGATATLTLSAEVQQTALDALDGRKGTIAVYNYRTGEILCAVTSPTYDPDQVPDIAADDSGEYDGVYLNRFTQVSYVPGSIFKVVTAGAALESMPEIRNETFYCSGEYLVDGSYVTCEDPHGEVDMGAALTQSCNCYFAQLAEKIGADTLSRFVEQFQVTQSQSFDGITTESGSVSISSDDPIGLAWSAIGQHEDLINPCRFMTFMGQIAGGGSAAEPYVVSQIRIGRSKTTYTAKASQTDSVLSEETARMLQTYMRNNVIDKYGDENFPGLSVCAKSGTAEVGGGQRSTALFAGFVTDSEYPLAFIAVVENGGYGRSVCVPIMSEVLSACKEILDQE